MCDVQRELVSGVQSVPAADEPSLGLAQGEMPHAFGREGIGITQPDRRERRGQVFPRDQIVHALRYVDPVESESRRRRLSRRNILEPLGDQLIRARQVHLDRLARDHELRDPSYRFGRSVGALQVVVGRRDVEARIGEVIFSRRMDGSLQQHVRSITRVQLDDALLGDRPRRQAVERDLVKRRGAGCPAETSSRKPRS